MEQTIKQAEQVVFDTISELAASTRGKIFTGREVTLEHVSIQRDGNLDFLVDREGGRIACFAEDKVKVKQGDPKIVTGTYHGDFFKILYNVD